MTTIYSQDNSVEYIIYTRESLKQAAVNLKNFYNNVENPYFVSTDIIVADSIPLNEFANHITENYILKYLLIIGDETIINPIKWYPNNNINATIKIPSDDYFSDSNVTLFEDSDDIGAIHFPNPTIATGRLLVSNINEAYSMISKIINYIENPSPGNWKNEILLIADDIYKNNKPIYNEIKHTKNSDLIYKKLYNDLNVKTLYGVNYPRTSSIDWYIQPELNNSIIQEINNNKFLINYIGHGTSNLLSDEHLLSFSDIDQINIDNSKLPIWIVGTCSFGNYLNQNCLAKKILNIGDDNSGAGIAVVSTTYNIDPDNNWSFINKFYDELSSYVLEQDNNSRLGDLFIAAKNNDDTNYKFHLFGDPAMPIHISKKSNSIIENGNLNEINIGTYNSIELDNNFLSTIKISLKENINYINFSDSTNIPQTMEYLTTNNQLYFNEFFGIDEFVLPIDIDILSNIYIKIHNEKKNTIQTIDNIVLSNNYEYVENNSDGPMIFIKHKNKILESDDILYPPYNMTIYLHNENPINTSGINNHDIRVWIDNNQNNSIILNSQYIDSTYETGYGGYINFSLEDSFELKNKHNFSIQAWDVFLKSTILVVENLRMYDNEKIFQVYNFPNPFKDKTYFTFHYKESTAINVSINIYTLNGERIYSIYEPSLLPSNDTFYRLNTMWDGKDMNNTIISNGTYLYELIIKNQSDDIIHNQIYKLTKLN